MQARSPAATERGQNQRLPRWQAPGVISHRSALCEQRMTMGRWKNDTIDTLFTTGLTRRAALQGIAGTALAPRCPTARLPKARSTLRWWSPQGAPAQRRGLQVPDRAPSRREPRHQGGVRGDVGRRLSRRSSPPPSPRARCRTSSRTCRPSRCTNYYAQRPARAVQRRDQRRSARRISIDGANRIYEIAGRQVLPAPASATRPPTCCGCART